ncbi:hypothetical protein V6N13_105176 [Hibiscus sabdariffa]
MSDSLVRVSRRAGWGARRPTPGARWCEARRDGACWVPRSSDDVSTGVSKARAWAATTIRVGPRPEPIGGPALAVPHPTGAHRRPPIRFPPDNFKHSLTLFSKSFSSFPRSTCSLSTAPRGATGSGHDGVSHPLRRPFPGDLGPGSVAEDASPDYNSDAEGDRFSSWAIPGSLAVTKGILAGFDNDPSAGSPTETLLRLLLPLNDKVQWTSRDVAGSEPPTSPRSEHFTGPFNRINQVAIPSRRPSRMVLNTLPRQGRGHNEARASFVSRDKMHKLRANRA